MSGMHVKYIRGGTLRPKMGILLHAPRAGGHNWQVSSSALLCILLQLSLKRANYGSHT